jgi:hypothetical protein
MLFCASLHHVKERGSNLGQNLSAAVFPAALSPFGIAKVAALFQLRNTRPQFFFTKPPKTLKTKSKYFEKNS